MMTVHCFCEKKLPWKVHLAFHYDVIAAYEKVPDETSAKNLRPALTTHGCRVELCSRVSGFVGENASGKKNLQLLFQFVDLRPIFAPTLINIHGVCKSSAVSTSLRRGCQHVGRYSNGVYSNKSAVMMGSFLER